MHGAAGRRGQRIVACALAEPEQWDLVAAIDRTGHPRLGEDAGQVAGVGQVGVGVEQLLRHRLADDVRPPKDYRFFSGKITEPSF